MRRGRHTRTLLAALALGAGALLVAAPAAMAGAIFPESGGSPNADDISTLYEITFYIGLVIFIGVEGTLIWSLVKYRARRGGPPAEQIHGNTPLEVGWTMGAAAIVVVLAAVTFVYLDDITNPPASGPDGLQAAEAVQFAAINQTEPPGGEGLKIGVNGQQYLWRYDYPGDQPLFAYHEMVVPVNTTVLLEITSQDVAHSWWIPELGGKADALPGHVNETWFKISEPGVYSGQCAELCGDNHADMRATVRALPVAEYEAWAQQQRADIQEAQEALAEQRERREETETRQ
ncbi:MAG: cytochrome c oxidase subunit II [Thermoleophilaceae bacterium]